MARYAYAFDHKAFGRIGTVELVAPDTGWTLNGKPVESGAAIEYLLRMGIHNPALDSYAGAETAEAAVEAFNEKVARIADGTVGTRAAGVGAWQTIARQIARAAIKANEPATFKQFKEMDDDAVNALLDGRIEEKRAAYETAVKAEVARREKERAEKAELVATL